MRLAVRIEPRLALDGGAAFAVVGQPIGRIGNLINGDILGSPSTLPWATAYANPRCCSPKRVSTLLVDELYRLPTRRRVRGAGHHRIGLLLLVLYRRRVPLGVIAITYVVAYSITQLIVFQFRASEPAVLLRLR